MNKTKAIESAKSALQAFQNQAAAIRKEREDVAVQIEKLKSEIKRLRDMPVSKTDFSLLLKEHIAAESKQAEQILIDLLTSERRGFGENAAIEIPSYNNMPLNELETHTIGRKGIRYIARKLDFLRLPRGTRRILIRQFFQPWRRPYIKHTLLLRPRCGSQPNYANH